MLNFRQLIDLMLIYFHRQNITFVDVKKTPLVPIKADYVPRGTLKYELSTEVLQTPIQLLRITNAEAQVP